MNIPTKGQKPPSYQKSKICVECGNEFTGMAKQKMCSVCGNSLPIRYKRRNLARKIKRDETGIGDNKLIYNEHWDIVPQTHNCELCGKPFIINVYPSSRKRGGSDLNITYPKFCEEHRNEYKRFYYNRKVA